MPQTPEQLRLLPSTEAVALPPLLLALWHEAQGHWDAAHATAQDIDTPDGAWLHAHLHRHEGDLANAAYWYRRAGRPVDRGSLDEEWTRLANHLLPNGPDWPR